MKLCCENCGNFFTNPGSFFSHKKYCKISENDRQKIRDLYNSGLLIKDIIQIGYTRNQINRCIKDLKRTASDTLKIAHTKIYRKKAINSFSDKKIICKKCNRSFNSGNYKRHKCYEDNDVIKIRNLYDSGLSSRELHNQGFDTGLIHFALKCYRRSVADASKLAHKKYTFKWSDESRKKWSEKCKIMHAENRANSWYKQDNQSYAEKTFFKFLINEGYKLNDDFYTEFPFSVYRVDFFFPKLSLAIEIDGQQHYRYKRRQEIDKKKDALLKLNNITVFRICWRAICYNSKDKFQEIKSILKSSEKRDVLISQYTDKQLVALNNLAEITKRKNEKISKIIKIRNELRQNRLNDLEKVDINKRGTFAILAKLWNVSQTQVKRFIKYNTKYTIKRFYKIKTIITSDLAKQIIDDYKNNNSLSKICRKYNVLNKKVKQLFLDNNISIKNSGYFIKKRWCDRNVSFRINDIINDYQNGFKIGVLIKKYKITRRMIKKIISKQLVTQL